MFSASAQKCSQPGDVRSSSSPVIWIASIPSVSNVVRRPSPSTKMIEAASRSRLRTSSIGIEPAISTEIDAA
jgi:hypothetical protein